MTPLARNTDAQTSHGAAESMVASGKVATHEQLILDVVAANPNLTSAEIYQKIHGDPFRTGHVEANRRLSGLETKERVYKTGSRECTVNKTKMSTWAAIDLFELC